MTLLTTSVTRLRAAPLIAIIGFLISVRTSVAQVERGPKDVDCQNALRILPNSAFELQVGPTELHDGKACLKPNAASPRCEWAVELKRAEWWGTKRPLLLAVVNAVHDSSGAWDSVFVYVCRHERLAPVFSRRYLYGGKIELGRNSDFWMTRGVWKKGDPACCPSLERRERYAWDERRQRMIVTSSRVTAVRR